MDRVTWRDEGWDEMAEDAERATLAQLRMAVIRAQEHMVAKIRQLFASPKSGEVYRVPNTTTRTWRASAPGEAPAIRLGQLNRAVKAADLEVEGTELRGAVGVSGNQAAAAYAPGLEFGHVRTLDNGATIRVEPRPFLRPAFRQEEGAVDSIIRRELDR